MTNTHSESNTQSVATNWKLELSRSVTDDAWDEFLSETKAGHHVQSALWAKLKAPLGWQVLRIKVLESGQIIAGIQILMTRKKLLGKIAFASKGPLFLETSMALSKYLLEAVQKHIKEEGIRYFALQPALMSAGLKNTLGQMGFSQSDTKLAPSSTVILDLAQSEDELLAQMRKKTRQYIRRGAREGLQVREAIEADMAGFYELLMFSAKRIGFTPFAQSYYQDMWHSFKQSKIKTQDSAVFIAELASDTADTKNTYIAAVLVIGFNDTVITKTIGWSGLHANYRPNEAVYWAAIQWAKRKGYRYCDLEGIEDQAADKILSGEALSETQRRTPSFFKIGFGGQVTRMPSAHEYIPNPIFKWAYKTVLPKIRNTTLVERLLERIRTQNHGGE